MPLGVVSDEDFLAEKENSNIEIRERPSKGRSEGDNNVPEFVRNIISDSAITDGNTAANKLASMLGISESSVSAYKHGATSTDSYNTPVPALLAANNGSKDRAIKRASGKMMAALAHITAAKLEATKARELAGIAKDMSTIVKNMEPPSGQQNPNGDRPNVNFVFYTPVVRKLESYDEVLSVD